MPELALGVADGEEASAIELLLVFHDDVRAGGFHSLVMRLDIADGLQPWYQRLTI